MEWLSQNWIWIALAVGVLWLYSRGRHGGLLGGRGAHQTAHNGPAGDGKAQGADTARSPIKQEGVGQTGERSASSHRHGGGGCC